MKSIKGLSFYSSEGSLIDVEELYAQVQQLEQDSAAKIIIGETASTTSTTSSDIDELAGTETDISLTNADDFKAGDMGISVVTVTDRNNSHGFMVFLALADEPDQPAGTLHVRFITGIYNGKDGAQIIKAQMNVTPSYSTSELTAMVGTQTTVNNPTNLSDIRVGDVVELPVTISNKANAAALVTGLVKVKTPSSISMEVLAVTWSGTDGTNGVDYIVTSEQYSTMLEEGTLEDDAIYYVLGTTDGVLQTANADVITEAQYTQLLEDGDVDETRLYYIEGTSDGALSFVASSVSYNSEGSVLTATNVQDALDQVVEKVDEIGGETDSLTTKVSTLQTKTNSLTTDVEELQEDFAAFSVDAAAVAAAMGITTDQLSKLSAFAKTIVSSDTTQTVVNNGLAGTGFNTTA